MALDHLLTLDADALALGRVLAWFGLPDSSPQVRQAQESLDLAIEALVSAYAEKVGAKLAHQKTTQHLLARAYRKLLGVENSSQPNTAG